MYEQIFGTLYLIAAILVRIGIPLALTFALGWYLRKLDAKWRDEAAQAKGQVSFSATLPSSTLQCWEFNECPEEKRKNCVAYQNTETPCWEALKINGTLAKSCQSCEYRISVTQPAGMN